MRITEYILQTQYLQTDIITQLEKNPKFKGKIPRVLVDEEDLLIFLENIGFFPGKTSRLCLEQYWSQAAS